MDRHLQRYGYVAVRVIRQQHTMDDMKRHIRDIESRCGPAVMLFLALTFGCTDPPAAPTPPVIAPAPPAVSLEIDPAMAQVGEVVTFTYRLSRALGDDLEFWTENTPRNARRG